MLPLYPDIQPYQTHLLDREKLPQGGMHQLYIEECGNPDGIPILFIHGGPGSGCRPAHRCYFDPEYYRIILFDQRGCGRSLPHGELTHNTTPHLIADIEAIRQHLNIQQWAIFGGSWGTTLGLLYAQHYPEKVTAMILRGIFLGRQQDINWVYGEEGAAKLFPDAWQRLLSHLNPEEQDTPLQAYYQRLTGNDELQRMAAAHYLQTWENTIVTLRDHELIPDLDRDPGPLAHARIQLHYSLNECFIADTPILDDIDLIRHIPTTIIQGRYDIVCPMQQAWALHQAWPESVLQIIPVAGHAAGEPAVINALISATRHLATDNQDDQA
jgi:proline iminopeptidase